MKKFSRFSYPVELYIQKSERSFLAFIILCFLLAMFSAPYPNLAMWVGFLFAAYAAVANDSIQTIGTFIASNQDKKWWILWLFLGGIFVTTITYSWLNFNGDVSNGRLSKGFEKPQLLFIFYRLPRRYSYYSY